MPDDERDFELIFKYYDKSNDGRIDYKELSKIFTAGREESEPSLAQ
jgi:Ca2+-binding EF-hand superfamily protein